MGFVVSDVFRHVKCAFFCVCRWLVGMWSVWYCRWICVIFLCLVQLLYILNVLVYKGGWGLISLWLYKENQQGTGLKKCIYSTYSPLSSTHLWLRCSNFFNPSKKNYFGCAANREIGNRKSQRLISTSTYVGSCSVWVSQLWYGLPGWVLLSLKLT
jgi:hypothetical protein